MSYEQDASARKLHEAVVLFREFGGTHEWDRVEYLFWDLFSDYVTEVEVEQEVQGLPSSIVQEKVVELHDKLIYGFSWHEHGGYHYWNEVRRNLAPLLPVGHNRDATRAIEGDPLLVRENADKLSKTLSSAFYWDDVEPGFSYWSEVHAKLRRIANEVHP